MTEFSEDSEITVQFLRETRDFFTDQSPAIVPLIGDLTDLYADASGINRFPFSKAFSVLGPALGSRLIDFQSQKMTVAARATADRKVVAHLSQRFREM